MEFKYQPGDLIAYISPRDPNDLSDMSIVIQHKVCSLDSKYDYEDQYVVFEIETQRYQHWTRAFLEESESWKLIQ